MYFPTYSYLIIVNKYKSFTVFSLLPKFLQVQVRSRSKVVLGDTVVCVGVGAVVVIKPLEEPLGRGPHHHPQRMILRFICGSKVLA